MVPNLVSQTVASDNCTVAGSLTIAQNPPAGIVIDLSQLNYFGSVFVNFLLRCYMYAKKEGIEFVLAGPSPASRELFKVLGFESLWALYATRQEAVEALSD